MTRHKVLVVDDSAFMRKLITDLISEDPAFEIAGTAKNGREAVDKTLLLRPDVITMDIQMPIMDGISALQEIMAKCPTPVIMLSGLTNDDDRETIVALEHGAVDFIRKPSGDISVDLYKVKELLHQKLYIALHAKLAHKPSIARVSQAQSLSLPSSTSGKRFKHLVAIGTSTGGPKALQRVLPNLPGNFPAPILIVQHMPANFTRSLAQRLDVLSQIRVVEAEQHMPIEAATAYIAPGDFHMKLVRRGKDEYLIKLTQEAPQNGHRPSVDVTFDSLLPFDELTRHLVIMTGMGSDGARAMKRLVDAGVKSTIAESEETCVVYGMPKVAVELQAAKHILPLDDIPQKLTEIVR